MSRAQFSSLFLLTLAILLLQVSQIKSVKADIDQLRTAALICTALSLVAALYALLENQE